MNRCNSFFEFFIVSDYFLQLPIQFKLFCVDKTQLCRVNSLVNQVLLFFPQKHISIVDTPGISELDNTTLMDRLFEYLPNAIAIIYVIDASSAGGLFNDRWVGFSPYIYIEIFVPYIRLNLNRIPHLHFNLPNVNDYLPNS